MRRSPVLPGIPALARGRCLHVTGVPAQLKRAQQRMRRNP